MNYLIIPCNLDLDTIVAMYSYYKFIEFAGFNVSCYLKHDLEDNIKSILKKLNIQFEIKSNIDINDNIILLNNAKLWLPENISSDQVTEIISLRLYDFSDYCNANIKQESVSLLSTLIVERYREYKLKFPNELIALLIYLYSNCNLNLKERDKISEDYLKLLNK